VTARQRKALAAQADFPHLLRCGRCGQGGGTLRFKYEHETGAAFYVHTRSRFCADWAKSREPYLGNWLRHKAVSQ
jgi:hypothetical protein